MSNNLEKQKTRTVEGFKVYLSPGWEIALIVIAIICVGIGSFARFGRRR